MWLKCKPEICLRVNLILCNKECSDRRENNTNEIIWEVHQQQILLLNIILPNMQSSAETVITCKNCSNQFTGNYCNNCGEKVYTAHDKSILHFLEEGMHFITHFDGSFFSTLKAIFTTPGKLSTDYTNGIRKRYFKPLSF